MLVKRIKPQDAIKNDECKLVKYNTTQKIMRNIQEIHEKRKAVNINILTIQIIINIKKLLLKDMHH